MKTSVILLGHGSMAKGGNFALKDMAGLVKEMGGMDVIPAYLQFKEPSLPQAVEAAVGEGADKIVVMPYFLYTGNHVQQDIPGELDEMRAKYPGVEMVMTGHLGAHPKLAEVVIERIKGSL